MSERTFLPDFESEERRHSFYSAHAKEKFTDERKHYFDESEVNELSRESSYSGGEIIAVEDILKMVQGLVKKGSEEAVIIEFPQTVGKDVLTETRRRNDLMVRKGYHVIEETIWGFVDDQSLTMRYFNIEGNEMDERRRSLSAKEKREYLGVFAAMQAVEKFDDEVNKANDEFEELKKTGTNDTTF